MTQAMERVRGFLKNRSRQWTHQRAQILDELRGIGEHFDADGLWDRLQHRGLKVSRATVYRTLPLLEECGVIRQVFTVGGRAHYEVKAAHHDHMLCIRCGKVIEFRDDRIERLQDAVCRRHGFRALDHRMGIRGLCRECCKLSDKGGTA
jgi:Fur family ferric uptake transcriptional regulator